MKKVTACAHPNIAFIKYWGRSDELDRLPLNASVSLNLDRFQAITTIEALAQRKSAKDQIISRGAKLRNREQQRLQRFLKRGKQFLEIDQPVQVTLQSDVPKGVGLASSAAVFASLSAALSGFKGRVSEKRISILARLGSGSACRSVPSGFVRWKRGTALTSYAYSIAPPDHLPIVDLILVTGREKQTSSSEGQKRVHTSPYLPNRLREVQRRERRCVQAIRQVDIPLLFELITEETLSFLALLLTQRPPLFYLSLPSLKALASALRWQLAGFPLAFTFDAGDTLHLILKESDLSALPKALKKRGWLARPAHGARLTRRGC